MKLSQFVLLQAQVDLRVRQYRLRELKRVSNPSKDDIGDLLVQVIQEEPQISSKAEKLLKQLLDDERTPAEVVEDLDELYQTVKVKWMQIAKKDLPGVKTKIEKAIRKELKLSRDPWLKQNWRKLPKAITKKMDDWIIMLPASVWRHKKHDSFLYFVVFGTTHMLSGHIHYRRDNSRYQRYRYYVSIDSRLGDELAQNPPKVLRLTQMPSNKSEQTPLGID
jgi:hypothetical protein